MSDRSRIEWTEATWNPVTGCTKVSPGCDHCYAERIVDRFKGKGAFATVELSAPKLEAPFKWRTARMVFVNSMSDLFHDDVPDTFLDEVFGVMAVAHAMRGHIFQILTKRPGRMRSYLNQTIRQMPGGHQGSTRQAIAGAAHRWAIDRINAGALSDAIETGDGWPLPNVWLGVSVEDQKWADIRIPALLETPAAVRWLSCEPLLGPIDLKRWLGPVAWPECWNRHTPSAECSSCIQPDWVVAGGESGPSARPMHPDWARSLRDQCAKVELPFFFKQWGEFVPLNVGEEGDAPFLIVPEYGWSLKGSFTRGASMRRVGKMRAGRELDGRTWDQYPAVSR